MRYIALLHGINVGGSTMIKMANLRECMTSIGYTHVQTYINSGNVLFETEETVEADLARTIEQAIFTAANLVVRVVVLNKNDYSDIIRNAPKGWGEKDGWKYNVLFLIPPYSMTSILADIGELKPNIEEVIPGNGVIYQSLLFEQFGRTSSGKLAARASYKQITVRNWNTVRKLYGILHA